MNKVKLGILMALLSQIIACGQMDSEKIDDSAQSLLDEYSRQMYRAEDRETTYDQRDECDTSQDDNNRDGGEIDPVILGVSGEGYLVGDVWTGDEDQTGEPPFPEGGEIPIGIVPFDEPEGCKIDPVRL